MVRLLIFLFMLHSFIISTEIIRWDAEYRWHFCELKFSIFRNSIPLLQRSTEFLFRLYIFQCPMISFSTKYYLRTAARLKVLCIETLEQLWNWDKMSVFYLIFYNILRKLCTTFREFTNHLQCKVSTVYKFIKNFDNSKSRERTLSRFAWQTGREISSRIN